MRFALFNVSGTFINHPARLCVVKARSYEDAFVKCKEILSKGISEQLGLKVRPGVKIHFTVLAQDLSLGYGEQVMYTTCSIEDSGGFIIDTYEYAIKPLD